MKKHEIESLLKSFLLFFISFGLFLTFIVYLGYKQKVNDLDEKIFTQMRLCSFDLKCPDFKIDFKDKKNKKPLFLYTEDDKLEAYFSLPNSQTYFLSISYPKQKYKEKKFAIFKDTIAELLLFLFILAILSTLFSFYSLYPMKKALLTIEEFIKDILHDFNTPISSIVLNSALLEKDETNSDKIQRIQQSAKNILSLQENLKVCLLELKTQQDSFDLRKLIVQKQKSLKKIYPHIHWKVDRRSLKLKTNKEAFSRIIINILTNAAKYNRHKGTITVKIDREKSTLTISDTGVGIKKPHKIFDRFYTENSRGTGIGLHIVKKLCEELKVGIEVTSEEGKGSSFTLYLEKLTQG